MDQGPHIGLVGGHANQKKKSVPGRCSLPGDYVTLIRHFSNFLVPFIGAWGVWWGFGGGESKSGNGMGVWWGFGIGIYLKQNKSNAICSSQQPKGMDISWAKRLVFWVREGLFLVGLRSSLWMWWGSSGVPVGLRWGSSGVSASAETAPKPPYDNNHKLGYNPHNFGIETTY